MESHETLDNVQEMKDVLKEILNTLKDIKDTFKSSTRGEAITVTGDDEFLKALQVVMPVEVKSVKPTKKVKDNVETA